MSKNYIRFYKWHTLLIRLGCLEAGIDSFGIWINNWRWYWGRWPFFKHE